MNPQQLKLEIEIWVFKHRGLTILIVIFCLLYLWHLLGY